MEVCKIKIAVVISHPIQHFCPQYVSFAENKHVDFKVFFASALGYRKYHDPNFKKDIVWNNLKLDQFEHEFLNGDVVYPSNGALDAPSLAERLQNFNPSGIIVYGYFQKFQRRAYNWAVKNNVALLYISDSERKQKRNFIKETIKYLFIRTYFSKVNYFLTVGDANEEYYKFYGVSDKKFVRMHFPIDIELYKKSYERKSQLNKVVRTLFKIQEKEIVISVVGKLVPWKNQNHLIETIKLLDGKGYIIHLFILGSGPMLAEWKEKAHRLNFCKIHMPGFTSPEELPAYYAASDIYIHPASVEPHSLAISEAIYMGCPVIVSDRCGSHGPTDDVQHGKNGFVYEFGNISELSKYITDLMASPQLRNDFSQYSLAIARGFQERAHRGAIEDIVAELN